MPGLSDIIKIAKEIFKEIQTSTQGQIDLVKYCTAKVKRTYPNLSILETAEELDKIIAKVKFYLNKEKERCENQGITPEYEFNDYPPNALFRYSIKHKEDPWLSELRKQKKVLIEAINKTSWRDFENLCRYVLKEKGITKIELTKKNLEGIDFCGLVNIGGHPTCGFIPPNFEVRVIGQVKHFSKKISPGQVRAFHTYYTSVQQGDPAVISKLPQWFNSTKSPILCIFMTTSSFTRRAIDYAEKEWIILKTGEQIAEDLITSSDAKKWFQKNKRGQLFFKPKSFKNSFRKNT